MCDVLCHHLFLLYYRELIRLIVLICYLIYETSGLSKASSQENDFTLKLAYKQVHVNICMYI